MTTSQRTAPPHAPPDFALWWAAQRETTHFEVTPVEFDALDSWYFDPADGNLRHRSGRFFTVEGLRHRGDGADSLTQPVLHQPEIGILGFLARRAGPGWQVLVQAKAEPGNINGLQLSPTVQATRSNYMRVHRGTDTRYLEYFRGTRERQVLVDSLQSEQGAWFFRNRNRNIVVEVGPEVPAQDGFHWMDLDVLRALMAVENLVSMDARSVLSCMTFLRPGDAGLDGDAFVQALKASYGVMGPQNGAQHSTMEVLSWFTEAKAGSEVRSELIPLDQVKHWTRTPSEITEDAGADFRILAVDIVAPGREVPAWSQPVLAPCGTGLAVFLTRQINGVLHVLIQALSQQGLRDVTELAPTVQHPGGTDAYLEVALTEDPAQVRFDTVLSEEGGRFYHALTRYRIIEVDEDFQCDLPAAYRWLTVRQLTDLVRHGHYLNVEARSLLACLHSLW